MTLKLDLRSHASQNIPVKQGGARRMRTYDLTRRCAPNSAERIAGAIAGAQVDLKPWTYVLIPHDAIAENMTLKGLSKMFSVPHSD